jgi:hypothetical protein
MRMKTFLATATFAAAVGMTSSASAQSAESARVVAIREGIRALDDRSDAVRERIDRAPPVVRRESERVMVVVERNRVSLSTRLAIIELLGWTADKDGFAIHEMEAMITSAARLLSIVEGWYSMR